MSPVTQAGKDLPCASTSPVPEPFRKSLCRVCLVTLEYTSLYLYNYFIYCLVTIAPWRGRKTLYGEPILNLQVGY